MLFDAPLRTTRFSDVCGSLDELKRLLREEKAPDPAVMQNLLEDVRYMLGRMERRLQEYAQFQEAAESLLEKMRAVGPSHRERALAACDEMEERLQAGSPATPDEVEALCALAEQIRAVANSLEGKLRQSKEAAIALYRLYRDLRGERNWSREEESQGESTPHDVASLAQHLQPWLPPSPHREHILDFLARGRAHLLSAPEGQAPLVEFEDGGVMPLPVVRWSQAVRNFYPEGQTPHPAGRKYRPEE